MDAASLRRTTTSIALRQARMANRLQGGGVKRKKSRRGIRDSGKAERRPNSYGRHAKPNAGLTLTVPATNELCDERWQELGLDVKVRLLNSLSEA